ncbi:MAG: hemerythrin family protein [Candidatus Thiodiazotropha sp.]
MSPYHLPVVDIAELPSVAQASMNEVHMEEVGLINRLGEMVLQAIDGALDREQISHLLAEWVEHTRAHFEGENRLMESHAFPPYPVHKAEHAAVLTRIESVQDQWLREHGLQQLADYIFVEWRAWFDQHVKSMDMVTAQFLSQVM